MLLLFDTACLFKGKKVGRLSCVMMHRKTHEVGKLLIAPEKGRAGLLEHEIEDIYSADPYLIRLTAFHRTAYAEPESIEVREAIDEAERIELPEFLVIDSRTGIYCQDSPAGKTCGVQVNPENRSVSHFLLRTGALAERTIALEISTLRRLRPGMLELNLGIEDLARFPSCIARP
jgi:hypothetical protein